MIWRTGWTSLKPLALPAALRKSAVVVTSLNDINQHGDIAGDVYGLSGKDFAKLRRDRSGRLALRVRALTLFVVL